MTLKEYLYKQFQGFSKKLVPWIEEKISALKASLNLEDIKDVEASAEEVNHLSGVTSNVQEQLDGKAPLDSPSLKGTPTAPTAEAGTDSTQIATTAFVKTAVDAKAEELKASFGAALEYKGSVPTYEELPNSGLQKGDTYNVNAAHGNTPAGTNYAWDGEKWDALGGDIDLSGLAEKADTLAGYGIKDAKIADGVITLGANTITPLTEADFVDITEEEFSQMLA